MIKVRSTNREDMRSKKNKLSPKFPHTSYGWNLVTAQMTSVAISIKIVASLISIMAADNKLKINIIALYIFYICNVT